MTTPDHGAETLNVHLRNNIPFFFLRYGDGALECIFGGWRRPYTCDGESYSEELSKDLLWAWWSVMANPRDSKVYIGDWLTASFNGPPTHTEQWKRLLGTYRPTMLHFESLLMMRESRQLSDFYATLRADGRRKLYMGPLENANAAAHLGCEHLVTPMGGLNRNWMDRTAGELCRRDYDVLLYGAGMAAHVPVVRAWQHHPDRTFIHVGSALDILFWKPSRSKQLTQDDARRMLGIPQDALPKFVEFRRGKVIPKMKVAR